MPIVPIFRLMRLTVRGTFSMSISLTWPKLLLALGCKHPQESTWQSKFRAGQLASTSFMISSVEGRTSPITRPVLRGRIRGKVALKLSIADPFN